MKNIAKCGYFFTDEQRHCSRKVEDGQHYCIFHLPDRSSKADITRFWWRLKRLFFKGDGDWRGFRFPPVNLENVTCEIPLKLNKAHFLGDVILKQCKFEKSVDAVNIFPKSSFLLSSVEFFDELNISHSNFKSSFSLNAIRAKKGVAANNCKFDSTFYASGLVEGMANFSHCIFSGKSEFRAMKHVTSSFLLSGRIRTRVGGMKLSVKSTNLSIIQLITNILIDFKNSIIYQSREICNFVKEKSIDYWFKAKITARKEYELMREKFPHNRKGTERLVLFGGGASFGYVEFIEPEKTLFKGVNLSDVTFEGTDLRKVNFVGNSWYQPRFKKEWYC